MCGIAGILSNVASIYSYNIINMIKVLIHRGPDGIGFWNNSDNQILLGHSRLSIVDLTTRGMQPMTYLNRYTVVYNGEIYNYLSLKKRLSAKGYKFKSNTDTEVLLALYDDKKEKCLEDLIGMFAFAIWDDWEKILFIARDRMGKKPLYYYFDSEKFMFASEIKSLIAGGLSINIDKEMIYDYLVSGNLFNPNNLIKTFYKEINKLEAAHYLIIDVQNWIIKKEKYWSLHISDQNISMSQAREMIELLFLDALKIRIPSDVKIASTLSGGLDSSIIVSVLTKKKWLNYDLDTFSARFPGFKKDEGIYIQQMLDMYHLNNICIPITEDIFIENYEELFYYQDEPYDGASYLAEYQVMKYVKQHGYKVLLDGQGADEIFGGYTSYFNTIFLNMLRNNPYHFLRAYYTYRKKVNEPIPVGIKFIMQAFYPKLYVYFKNIRNNLNFSKLLNKDFYAEHHKPVQYEINTHIHEHMYKDTV